MNGQQENATSPLPSVFLLVQSGRVSAAGVFRFRPRFRRKRKERSSGGSKASVSSRLRGARLKVQRGQQLGLGFSPQAVQQLESQVQAERATPGPGAGAAP